MYFEEWNKERGGQEMRVKKWVFFFFSFQFNEEEKIATGKIAAICFKLPSKLYPFLILILYIPSIQPEWLFMRW